MGLRHGKGIHSDDCSALTDLPAAPGARFQSGAARLQELAHVLVEVPPSLASPMPDDAPKRARPHLSPAGELKGAGAVAGARAVAGAGEPPWVHLQAAHQPPAYLCTTHAARSASDAHPGRDSSATPRSLITFSASSFSCVGTGAKTRAPALVLPWSEPQAGRHSHWGIDSSSAPDYPLLGKAQSVHLIESPCSCSAW